MTTSLLQCKERNEILELVQVEHHHEVTSRNYCEWMGLVSNSHMRVQVADEADGCNAYLYQHIKM